METPSSTRFQFVFPSTGTPLSTTAFCNSASSFNGDKHLYLPPSFPEDATIKASWLIFLGVRTPCSAKMMLPKLHKRVQFLKVDVFRLVLLVCSEIKEMSLLHCCKSSIEGSLSLIVAESFSALFTATLVHLRRCTQEDTTRHMCVSIPQFSLTARCGTSAVPGDLWPQHKLYFLPCRLQTGCTQLLKHRFSEAL